MVTTMPIQQSLFLLAYLTAIALRSFRFPFGLSVMDGLNHTRRLTDQVLIGMQK
jgi:hypothetical protein